MPALSLRQVEQALRHADPQTRHQTLRAVADLFLSALAVKTGLKYEAVEKLMHPSRVSGVILVCKALGLSWATVDPLLALCKIRNGLADADVARLRAEFLELSRAIAERIVRFWQLRQSVGAA